MLNYRKFKSLISTILIASFVISSVVFSYATGTENDGSNTGGNDVNVSGVDYEVNANWSGDNDPNKVGKHHVLEGLQRPEQIGARVSLYDIESQDLINTLDFVSDYEKCKNYRRVSKYSKTEIISLNGNIDEIEDNIKEDSKATLEKNLVKANMSFPNFFNTSVMGGSGGGYTASKIKKFYEKDEEVEKLLKNFPNKKEIWNKFKERKITILIEPLISVTNKWHELNDTYAFTCAEIGLLGLAGYIINAGKETYYDTEEEASNALSFEESIIGICSIVRERAFLALPYGTFKERPEYIKLIPDFNETIPIYIAAFSQMVDRLGCFEISAATISEIATTCTIKFDPNGKYFGLESSINEKFTIKDVKIDSEIKLIKTYEDNYFRDEISEEHVYSTYSLKIDNDGKPIGKIYQVDGNLKVTKELLNEENEIIVYVNWGDNSDNKEDEGSSKSMILYEDELSNVYDFNSIDSTGNTRKLQGVINFCYKLYN